MPVRVAGAQTREQRMAWRLYGSGTAAETAGMSAQELMELLCG
ncbi:hypothetical protein GCM10022402_04150 [Salinactinospora qingdaonensis]|uniref:Uncharacterized protein n=1 Tax=Salinactinospora qingdaonensis TaxID=702744 RepID=A0ABP7EYL3_9ACTN